VRVTDFALEILDYSRNIYLKNGSHLEVRIGIHSGMVVSVVVGDIKPQFSLIGGTVNKTSNICRVSVPLKVTVSQQTQHYLDLYTNNL
jgi:class 3 adenylate cyclase